MLVFREVARAGSLAGAARALGWTQPAVSQQVRRLERELSVALVVRLARGVDLTEAGETLLRHADAVAARVAAAGEEIAALADLRAGRVRLAAFPSASATLVPAALAGLRERHPQVDVRLTEVEPPDGLARLHAGEDDLAVVFGFAEEPGGETDLTEVALLDDPLLAVLPRTHPAARADGVALDELAGERWIAGCERCRSHLLARAAAAGFVPDVHHSTDDYVVVQHLVEAGLGVALLPGLALRATRLPGVAVVALPAEPPRAVSAVVRHGSTVVPAVSATLAALMAAVAAVTGSPIRAGA